VLTFSQYCCRPLKMSDDEETFESTTAVGDDCFPMQCSALRKNGFVGTRFPIFFFFLSFSERVTDNCAIVLKERPCKIMDMSTSKTGKHGHAKVNLVGIDIFNGRKYEDMCPSTHNMMVPHVSRTEYQLLDIGDDGFLSLLLPSGETKDDIKLPEGEIGDQIQTAFEAGKAVLVTVLAAMKEEAAVAYKESNAD